MNLAIGLALLLSLSTSVSAAATPEEVVRKLCKDFNSHDSDTLVSHVSDDVRWMTITGDKVAGEGPGSLVSSVAVWFPESSQALAKTRSQSSASGTRRCASISSCKPLASPLPSETASSALGVTRRLPKTARTRASRSGHGDVGLPELIGTKRATGRRRRVTSTTWPRSTRASTRLRFCCSSRIEIDVFGMVNILYDNWLTSTRAAQVCFSAPWSKTSGSQRPIAFDPIAPTSESSGLSIIRPNSYRNSILAQ